MKAEDILKKVNREDIFVKYFGNFTLKKYYKNPWRVDTKPNCWFTYRNNDLYFVDFGNDVKNINCFQACMYHYKCTYEQALIHIDVDFGLKLSPESLFSNKNKNKTNEIKTVKIQDNIKDSIDDITQLSEPTKYEFVYQDFRQYDVDYWKRFHYTKELVGIMKIRAVKTVHRNGELWATSFKDNLIYTYTDSLGEFKIYRPVSSKANKWRSLRPTLEGYELLEQSDFLFITSSYKDVGIIKLLGYQSVAPSSETAYKLLYDKLPELKEKYKYIYVFHNNDNTGKEFSKKITSEQGLYYINIPDNEPKDPSDYVEKYGLEALNKIIKNKIQRDGLFSS